MRSHPSIVCMRLARSLSLVARIRSIMLTSWLSRYEAGLRKQLSDKK